MGVYSSARQLLAEMIGAGQRIRRNFFTNVQRLTGTVDVGTTDYAFWDKARKGRARGLEVSGLLLKPIESKIASWTLGKPPKFKLDNAYAADRLNNWWNRNHAKILAVFQDSLGLGDYFLVVNADTTITPIGPNVVKPLVSDEDFGRLRGWRIEQTYPHPTEPGRSQVITEDYTAVSRLRVVVTDGRESRRQTYRNLVGRVPVIHIPNNKAADEMFGRPEGEALLTLLHYYEDIIKSALEGNKRQGRPTPAIERMGDAKAVEQFWNQYGKTRTIKQADGTTYVENYLDFDADQVLTLGGEAVFNWKSPGSFANDTQILLGLLFYLYLEHVELPEWVLGNAIASSRASAETQVEPLVKFIEKKRAMAEDWVQELSRVVLGLIGIVDVQAQISEDDEITIQWEDLTTADGSLTLSTIQWALEQGLIDRETALILAPVDVDDVAGVLKKAEDERKQRDEADQQASVERALERARQNADQQPNGQQPPNVLPQPPNAQPAPGANAQDNQDTNAAWPSTCQGRARCIVRN